MTEEELARKERSQKREFPETLKVMDAVRDALVTALLASKLGEADQRERLYQAVQVLDAMKKNMELVMSSGSEVIAEYVKKIAEGGPNSSA